MRVIHHECNTLQRLPILDSQNLRILQQLYLILLIRGSVNTNRSLQAWNLSLMETLQLELLRREVWMNKEVIVPKTIWIQATIKCHNWAKNGKISTRTHWELRMNLKTTSAILLEAAEMSVVLVEFRHLLLFPRVEPKEQRSSVRILSYDKSWTKWRRSLAKWIKSD